VTEAASIGQIPVIQFACRVGNSQDGFVGGLHISSNRITTVAEIAGQAGRLVRRRDVVLIICIEFSVLDVIIGITVAVNTAIPG
jgi:hypothetical protein